MNKINKIYKIFVLLILIININFTVAENTCSDIPILDQVEQFFKLYPSQDQDEQNNLLQNLINLKETSTINQHSDLNICQQFKNENTCCQPEQLNTFNQYTLNFFEQNKSKNNDFGYILNRLESALQRCTNSDDIDLVIEDKELFKKIKKTQDICQARVFRTQMRYYRGNICGLCVDPAKIDTYFTNTGSMKIEKDSYNEYMAEISSLQECLYDNSKEFELLFQEKIKQNLQIKYQSNECENVITKIEQVLNNSQTQIKKQCQDFDLFTAGCIQNLIQDEKEENKIDLISLEVVTEEYSVDEIDGENNSDVIDGENSDVDGEIQEENTIVSNNQDGENIDQNDGENQETIINVIISDSNNQKQNDFDIIQDFGLNNLENTNDQQKIDMQQQQLEEDIIIEDELQTENQQNEIIDIQENQQINQEETQQEDQNQQNEQIQVEQDKQNVDVEQDEQQIEENEQQIEQNEQQVEQVEQVEQQIEQNEQQIEQSEQQVIQDQQDEQYIEQDEQQIEQNEQQTEQDEQDQQQIEQTQQEQQIKQNDDVQTQDNVQIEQQQTVENIVEQNNQQEVVDKQQELQDQIAKLQEQLLQEQIKQLQDQLNSLQNTDTNNRILEEQIVDYSSQVPQNSQIIISDEGIKTYVEDINLEKQIIINGNNQADSLPSIINHQQNVNKEQETENNKENDENKDDDSNKTYLYLGIIAGLLLFSGIGFFGYQKYKERQTERQITFALDDFEKDAKQQVIVDTESQKQEKQPKKSSRKGKKKTEAEEDESLELSLMSNH